MGGIRWVQVILFSSALPSITPGKTKTDEKGTTYRDDLRQKFPADPKTN